MRGVSWRIRAGKGASMTAPTAYEQYLLELINTARADAGAAPLAFAGDLNEAADEHTQWMIASDTFSHYGSGGSTPGERMAQAGYAFSGSWTWGENVAWTSTRSPIGWQDEVLQLHNNLMNSAGHRANLLSSDFRQIGLGFEIGDYAGRQVGMLTEDFARSGSSRFLTGVAFDDKDGDLFYDVGEGLAGIAIKAVSTTGLSYTTTTMQAGGYQLALPAGTYSVTFSGTGIASTTVAATVGTQNAKANLVDPVATASQHIVGTSASDSLTGGAGNDILKGFGGNDTLNGGGGADILQGGAGADVLKGEAGNDVLNGGPGADILTGGAGADRFDFKTELAGEVDKITDFSSADDTIRLDDAVFAAIGSLGRLDATAYHIGAAAQDTADRIIYNPQNGNLSFDPDGTGAASASVFAQVAMSLVISNSDFLIV
jgi:serralysin